MNSRPYYDCDTQPYWCSDTSYNDSSTTFGHFIENGHGYLIENPDTPRPWLNYLANKRFGSVVSNRGMGFHWYRSTLLRITKYEHPVDYLPREFMDGRIVSFHDETTSLSHSMLPNGENLTCVHRPGSTTLSAEAGPLAFECTLFVPLDEPAEIWRFNVSNRSDSQVSGTLSFEQIWSIAIFGIHTAEEGIPYLSTPGKQAKISVVKHGVEGFTDNPELTMLLWTGFFSPQCEQSESEPLVENRKDGRVFTFHRCRLNKRVDLAPGETLSVDIVATASETEEVFNKTKSRYLQAGQAEESLGTVRKQWEQWIGHPSCSIPDTHIQHFLNVWFKNQLHLTFYFCRSGHHGYRDSLQDAWGYTLIDPEQAQARLFQILSHQNADGTAPRNFSAFDNGQHDMRQFMDSPVWIPRTLVDLIKETGNSAILHKSLPFLDESEGTVEEHAWRALDSLYKNRNAQGLCYTGDGDWNDALEGISKDGDAVSAWLTIALLDAMQFMVELYEFTKNDKRLAVIRSRAEELRRVLNDVAWDGDWYVYGFTGNEKPIGSHTNREGRIHLNAQAWAVFSGLADVERADTVMASVDEHLSTPLGPMLLAPPYVDEAKEVGRIAKLEPGTFENASVYQHAVAFHLFALLHLGRADEAVDLLGRLLPTNPDNFDSRRTSEPYCTGNYYCGKDHPRFGQNFFSWFTGNAAWLLRLGFDQLLGVRAGFQGLEINPCPPSHWDSYEVTRAYRGCTYHIRFERINNKSQPTVYVDGTQIDGCAIPIQDKTHSSVVVSF